MKTVGHALKHLVEGLMALCLLGMVLAVFGNVLLRYFWGTGWVVSEELSRLLFVWLVCLSATLAFGEGKHLGFDLVTARLTGAKALVFRWLTRALIAIALYYLITGSWAQVLVGMDSRSPVMNYPLAVAAAGTLVMGACMAVLLVLQSWNELRGHTPPGAEHTDEGARA
ncbi:TRAP transporter small permease [Hydrogenophaga sp.]|jgi:TRAP-type C4-dicarboxylate transport system permease small subunit|uniref:TRAP transporter small permease n=1 Tax=Hydrogenophaga sp. TaxID=1904254 RepID=UPI002730BF34|nr:TRAP transporter small permease [Hydrogenophaga sp.]MDP2406988.1 TRAP transporter small permease [Hydrogenophaga sp.]MDP3887976.1 TRAP transporter small permease [Hydrogenophaga sp.]MDZ4174234.1 TRAP transporter small permease [Hydrogenophaga sp.]